jgi:hypothetical protein
MVSKLKFCYILIMHLIFASGLANINKTGIPSPVSHGWELEAVYMVIVLLHSQQNLGSVD